MNKLKKKSLNKNNIKNTSKKAPKRTKKAKKKSAFELSIEKNKKKVSRWPKWKRNVFIGAVPVKTKAKEKAKTK